MKAPSWMQSAQKVRYRLAQPLVALGHCVLNWGARLSIDAYEENFDGTRPWGRRPRP